MFLVFGGSVKKLENLSTKNSNKSSQNFFGQKTLISWYLVFALNIILQIIAVLLSLEFFRLFSVLVAEGSTFLIAFPWFASLPLQLFAMIFLRFLLNKSPKGTLNYFSKIPAISYCLGAGIFMIYLLGFIYGSSRTSAIYPTSDNSYSESKYLSFGISSALIFVSAILFLGLYFGIARNWNSVVSVNNQLDFQKREETRIERLHQMAQNLVDEMSEIVKSGGKLWNVEGIKPNGAQQTINARRFNDIQINNKNINVWPNNHVFEIGDVIALSQNNTVLCVFTPSDLQIVVSAQSSGWVPSDMN